MDDADETQVGAPVSIDLWEQRLGALESTVNALDGEAETWRSRPVVRLRRLLPHAVRPHAHLDAVKLYACLEEPLDVHPNRWTQVTTGWGILMPPGWLGLIRPRRVLGATHGLICFADTLRPAEGVIPLDVMVTQVSNPAESSPSYAVGYHEWIADLVIVRATAPYLVDEGQ